MQQQIERRMRVHQLQIFIISHLYCKRTINLSLINEDLEPKVLTRVVFDLTLPFSTQKEIK